MLRDSIRAGAAGHHVEQVEIVFTPGPARWRVAAAWAETVARTEALRIAFLTAEGEARGWELAVPSLILNQRETVPASWQAWLDADRCQPLLAPREVPWRAVYWPEQGRFIWTLHHALLDGRSIARILRSFLARLRGGEAADLALAEWRAPSPAALLLAEAMLRETFVKLEPMDLGFPYEAPDAGPAVCCLGNDFAKRLEAIAGAVDVSTATILTWAWGQALAEASGTEAVMVEQLRAGAPREGSAGFMMNTLPVLVHRAIDGETEQNLRAFRTQLLALREIEAVSPADFPTGEFPDMDGPWTSLVMIECGTLQHMAGEAADGELVESLVLHEGEGESLMATAYILPDLRLEVEGLRRHDLLEKWISVLVSLANQLE